jgi:hypothetical protein
MISRPTVLILGAGASVPYGFPTGPGLRDLVCKPGAGGDKIAKAVVEAGFRPDTVGSFVTQLRESGCRSVDAFLEHRPDLVSIGKAAMAAALIPFERIDELFNALEDRGKWYAHLLEQLAAPPDRWAENRLTVVTYNYDRSLEFFLRKALANAFRLNPAEASSLADSLRVIHLHGFLAKLGDVSDGGRPYSPDTAPNRVKLAADQIRIVSEARPTDPGFAEARDALRAAERVYILGFGYSEVNLERLGHDCFPTGHAHFGSCYEMEEGERIDVEKWFGGSISLRQPDRDVLRFLRHHQSLRTP